MAFSHWYDRKEICKRALPEFFADCCTRRPIGARPKGPRGAHKGPALEGPGRHTRAQQQQGDDVSPSTKGPRATKGLAHEGPGGPPGPGPQGLREATRARPTNKGPVKPTRAQVAHMAGCLWAPWALWAGPRPCGPPGLWAAPLRVPWALVGSVALVGRAIVGPPGPLRAPIGPCEPPWAPVSWALVGPPGPLWAEP